MLIVLLLSCFMMIVPWNIYQNVSSPNFMKYLGFGEIDLMVGIYESNDAVDEEQQIVNYFSRNESVEQFVQITSKYFKVKKEDGSEEKIVIELGDHTAFPIE